MLLQKENIQYINSVTHAGKVVLFGIDTDGKVWYSIKQDGFEDSYLNTPPAERTGWEDWQELELPNEAEDDVSVVEKEKKEFTHQDDESEYILRSRYQTQSETAIVPVQLVSTVEHLYVFRQSKDNTLLCDRYVLDGIANQLVRKLQVRFKRSGQRFKASEKMRQGVGGLKNVDSLDYRDANGIPFYEPTTELTFINNLHQGWFSVIQLPTIEHAKYRWNIFAYNSQTQKIDLYSLRVSEEGLFDVYDYTIFTPKSEDEPTLLPLSIPGIIKRTLNLNLEVGNGISATKFYVQSSRDTEAGPQLMRDTTKVMLAIVTSD
ncbi:MAG: LamG domain-containing protein, partial [Moorea sp. SIO2B7]|nr:LamG domain-containing protein [Moorena sp. SIO2B7]